MRGGGLDLTRWSDIEPQIFGRTRRPLERANCDKPDHRMNLEHLLNAGLELEKRIARDQALRRCFSELWKKSNGQQLKGKTAESNGVREFKLKLPLDVCELIESTATLTGKTPSQLVQESFALYCRTHLNDPRP